MCWVMLEMLANLELPSSYKCVTYGIAEAACGLIFLEKYVCEKCEFCT
jgi:hypothetical protein